MTKHTKEMARLDPKSCFNKALNDEPVFVLRAKDPIADQVVRIWASLAASREVHEKDKIFTAYECAVLMKEWREKNVKT
jgi:hypothetical protein